MPKVSVIIPTYNNANQICEAIDSVLAQTFKDYEIIVVDDGSIDNTKKRIMKYGDKIKYLYQRNKGPSGARNKGIIESQGEYIAFLDADDLWLKDFLEKMVKKIEEGHDWVICNATKILFNKDKEIARVNLEDNLSRMNRYGSPVNLVLLEGVLGFIGVSLLRKKYLLENNFFFDGKLNGLEDRDMALRLLFNGCRVAFLNDYLEYYRRFIGFSHITKTGNTNIRLYNFYRKHWKLYITLGLQKELSSFFWSLSGEFIFVCGDLFKGVKSLFWSFFSSPFESGKHAANFLNKKLFYKFGFK